ncbi:MAG: hypothetical protein K2X53_03210 [Alphaproteobacteria bacterium]|nr:hypothetical protein [Alphaproteobacteria bacterium]
MDYDMPGLNGLELCRQIESPSIQRIMLTGAATHQIAVDAFNEGIIDQFIQKNDVALFNKLQSAVVNAQAKYFDIVTSDLVKQLLLEYPETEALKDPVFMEFFEKLLHKKRVTEYYLLDTMGSFLFLSDSGNLSALFIFNEETLEFQEDMIPKTDRTTDLAKEIYAKKQAICFYPFTTLKDYAESDWKKYVYPLSQLDGKNTYFWAYVDSLPSLQSDQIVSFSGYKEDSQ